MIRHAPSIGIGIGLSLRSQGAAGAAFSGLLDQYGGAAAAYSLRALSSGWVAGDVVEVRPSSGWTPASFTAGQVANGEMVDYVKRPGNFTNVAINPFEEFTNNGEGDGFTAKDTTSAGFASAYVVSGAASDVVTVSFDLAIVSGSPSVSLRNAPNQTRSNIEVISTNGSHSVVLTATGSFNNFSIADGDIPSEFTVSNVRFSTADGFVSTWYDQSGNANNATQATTTSQPKIVSAGTLVAGGLDFDGVDDRLITGSFSLTQAFTSFSVTSTDVSSRSAGIWGVADSESSPFEATSFYRSDDGFAINSGETLTTASTQTYDTGRDYLKTSFFDSASSSIRVDGVTKVTATAGTSNPSGLLMLGQFMSSSGTTAVRLNGKIQEIIIYDSDQTANSVAIEANINDFYTIY